MWRKDRKKNREITDKRGKESVDICDLCHFFTADFIIYCLNALVKKLLTNIIVIRIEHNISSWFILLLRLLLSLPNESVSLLMYSLSLYFHNSSN